ncbi:hypothetical protein [Paenibacillus senegalensis]|uniref:hypothetical protein n=1 Tax=Paenibacillus senegalensis TaxID=1465766 RepID=UPI000289310B|nr:hypothetical protein [Paenibacillus senegalensis]
MKSWFQQLRLEIRLLNGQSYLYLLPLLYGAWLAFHLSSTVDAEGYGNLFVLVFQFHSMQFVLTLGVAMILGILLIRRDLHRAGYGWMRSLPITSFTQVTTKFAAAFGYLTLFTVSMTLVVVYYGIINEWPWPTLRDHLLFFIVQAQLAYAVTLALALLLGVTITSRICYLIGFCAWMFGTFFIDLVLVTGMRAYPLVTFHLSQFTLSSPLENEMSGYSLFQYELITIRTFALWFTALMLVSAIAYLNRLRPSSRRRQWQAGFIFILILTIAAYYPNGALWIDRYTFQQETIAESLDLDFISAETVSAPTELQIREYHLNIINGPDDTFRLHAKLELAPNELNQPGQTLTFTLNRQFHVERVLLNGAEAPLSREGDFIRIDLQPLESDILVLEEIELLYSGNLEEWLVVDGYPSIAYFMTPEQVYLPEQAYWYPVPGQHYRYASIDNSFLTSLGAYPYYESPLDPISFVVKAEGFQHKLFSSLRQVESGNDSLDFQTFEGKSTGITLLGGKQLIEVSLPEEPVTIVTTSSNKRSAERFLTTLHEHLNYYRSWLDSPISDVEQIFYQQMNLPYQYPYGAVIKGHALFLEENLGSRLDDYTTHQALISLLFNDTIYYYDNYILSLDEENKSVTSHIRSAFFYLYLRDHLGFSHQEIIAGAYFDVYPLLMLHGYTNEPNLDIYAMIDQAVTEGNTEQAKKVLREFHRRGLTVSLTGNPYFSTESELKPVISKEDWLLVWKSFANKMN